MATETITAKPTIIDATIEEATTPQNSIIELNGKKRDLALLTDEDKKHYIALAKNINLRDVNSIANYGCELENTVSRSGTQILSKTRTTASDEMSSLLPTLLVELNEFDDDDFAEGNTFRKSVRKICKYIPIVRHLVKSAEKIEYKYSTIGKNLDTITNKIKAKRLSILEDNNSLEIMLQNNAQHKNQLEELIIAGTLKLEELKQQFDNMSAHADEYETYEITQVKDFIDNFDKRLADLRCIHYVVSQEIPKIRMMQNTNLAMANKAQTVIHLTLPLWREQLSTAVMLRKQAEGAKMFTKISETTDNLIKKNSQVLHDNTVMVAKENERTVVSLEVLKQTTEQLINTVKEVQQIHDEGAAKRRELETQLKSMNIELEGHLKSAGSISSSMTDAVKYLTDKAY